MELRFGFDPEDYRALEGAFRLAPQLAQDELQRFMHAATLELQAEVLEHTPTDRGTLRGSIHSQVLPLGFGVEGIVGTALNYALPVELGTKPHWVPLEPLIDWVRHKGLAAVAPYPRGTPKAKRKKLAVRRNAEVLRIARAIRFSIARRGTRPSRMFQKAWEAKRAQIEADMHDTVQRIVARIAGGNDGRPR